MGLSIGAIEKVAQYVEKCGVKSILETKPVNFNKINLGELKLVPQLSSDAVIIGKHKIPRYLYHFTNKEAYLSMLKDGKIKLGGNIDVIQGVYMTDIKNLFKNWTVSKDWKGHDLRKALLQQANKGTGKVVVLKIPTSAIAKNELLIRSQNKYFSNISTNEFEKAVEIWEKEKVIPNNKFKHMFAGDKATNSALYNQRKEAIEYIYPHEINISKVEKIGEADLTTIDKGTKLKDIYASLFKGTSQENALKSFKDAKENTLIEQALRKIELVKAIYAKPIEKFEFRIPATQKVINNFALTQEAKININPELLEKYKSLTLKPKTKNKIDFNSGILEKFKNSLYKANTANTF